MTGHCSKCGKIWTLDTAQGVCQWCGKLATCQTSRTQTRTIKSRPSKARPAPTNGGYNQLNGKWLDFYNVASRFNHKAKAEDTQDLLHDIIVALAEVANHKALTEPAMYRIASITLVHYWRAHYKLTSGIDCGSCSKAQRRKCKENDLYGKCPKAIKLEYLSKPVTDSDGNTTELGELIADDKALDLDAWLDNRAIILGCKPRLIAIAEKLQDGEALTNKEHQYLWRFRQREQKRLVLTVRK